MEPQPAPARRPAAEFLAAVSEDLARATDLLRRLRAARVQRAGGRAVEWNGPEERAEAAPPQAQAEREGRRAAPGPPAEPAGGAEESPSCRSCSGASSSYGCASSCAGGDLPPSAPLLCAECASLGVRLLRCAGGVARGRERRRAGAPAPEPEDDSGGEAAHEPVDGADGTALAKLRAVAERVAGMEAAVARALRAARPPSAAASDASDSIVRLKARRLRARWGGDAPVAAPLVLRVGAR
jgi:hypothetical protein